MKQSLPFLWKNITNYYNDEETYLHNHARSELAHLIKLCKRS